MSRKFKYLVLLVLLKHVICKKDRKARFLAAFCYTGRWDLTHCTGKEWGMKIKMGEMTRERGQKMD